METNTDRVKRNEGAQVRSESWLSAGWHEIRQTGNGDLPEITDWFTSRPVLFVADGKLCAGHYHDNGWFYNEVEGAGLFLARGKWSALKANEHPHVWCEKWRYMGQADNDGSERPPEL